MTYLFILYLSTFEQTLLQALSKRRLKFKLTRLSHELSFQNPANQQGLLQTNNLLTHALSPYGKILPQM